MSDQRKEVSLEGLSHENPPLRERFADSHDPMQEGGADVEKSRESVVEKKPTLDTVRDKVQEHEEIDHAHVMQDASDLHQLNDRDSQVQRLVDLAMNKGVVHAVAVAQKAGDFYMLDQLHDKLLSEELHEQLVARDLISLK